MTSKDFDALAKKADHTPSCDFTLGGRSWHVKNVNDVPFRFVEMSLQGEVKVDQFFSAVLAKDEVEDFLVLTNDPGSPLTIGSLKPVVDYIVAQVSGRPTKRPSSSEAGPPATNGKSVAASTSRARASKPSSSSRTARRSTSRTSSN